MAIALVGNWTAGQFSNNTGGSLPGRTSTAGNWLGIAVFASDAGAVFSDNKSNTFSSVPGFGATYDAGWLQRFFYVENAAGGASHTFSIATAGGNYSVLLAVEFSGLAASSSIDKNTSATGTGTSMSSGATAATTQADELVIGWGTNATPNNTNYSAGSGFAMPVQEPDGVNGGTGFYEYKIVSATGTQTATATHADNVGWFIAVATFKGDTGGPAAPTYNARRTGYGRPRLRPRVR